MIDERPQNALHERYASPSMARIFSAHNRYLQWRKLWVQLAECQRELGLAIGEGQIDRLKAVAADIDLERVAEIELETRHDVVAHLRHFAEQAGDAGGVLHLGATSAFITDNTDLLLSRQALELMIDRVAAVVANLGELARRTKEIPTLAYTHLQPAQLTTVGKRACLWAHDFLLDLAELRSLVADLRCRGAKGTTGTQASFLTLFDGDHDKVVALDRMLAERLGFEASYPVTGQTYPRKVDSRILRVLAGIAEGAHKMGNDVRLLQGLGELREAFDAKQVGSSAMAYKRNPIRSERLCALSRRLITDSLNGSLNAATQWLERSLDDSANRRLVLTDCFLTADAVAGLAAHVAEGLTPQTGVLAARVARELPFMATETFLMEAAKRGGDRQVLHERLRTYSMEAYAALSEGDENRLVERIAADPDFHLSLEEARDLLDPQAFTGRSSEQVDEFLSQVLEPALAGQTTAAVEAPRV